MLKESVKFGHLMIEDERILYTDDDFYYVRWIPTSPGHLLIITNGNEKDYFELSERRKKFH
jgi:diadenosine tetraphosphate (Ap4A) HIT family hydrolase